MKQLILILALLLAACSKPYATPEFIEHSAQLCSTNGGLDYIDSPTVTSEYESCGYKCSRKTGRIVGTGTVVCLNGATFDEIKIYIDRNNRASQK